MERWKFTREFKLEAVRLIRDRGVAVSVASAAAPFMGPAITAAVGSAWYLSSC